MDTLSAPVRAVDLARVVTTPEVVALLRDGCTAAGSQRAYAEANGLHPSDLAAVLKGTRAPTRSIRHAVGVEGAWILRGAK